MSARGIVAAAAGALLLTATLTGCGTTIEGNAQPLGSGGGEEAINTDFDKLLRECEVVAADKIGEIVGDAEMVLTSFSGAVCMWDIEDAPGGSAMATLNWYEMGTLNNEKATNDKLGYLTSDIAVQGRRALQVRRPGDNDSCGVTAPAADVGVVGWWINYRPGSAHPDPCAGAQKLVELTLDLAR
ncbi:hypothetical protein BOX37_29090 [Nocardia mangyaensis]|uniref:DUF3558 domain-containing protein n=1 Tax=Nocardia mangyaensis TaxID=2213200 RepID=A0A1J0VZG7_9NOCA|nr:DUF3558 domain-containing protein [Nocardia mangyaensis]APE37319.1 hypothetical protein BOX37_29090 [Nocardia mangyaensis]